jgi:hypothetical protein
MVPEPTTEDSKTGHRIRRPYMGTPSNSVSAHFNRGYQIMTKETGTGWNEMKKVFADYYEEINMAYLTAKEYDSTVANEYASISNILDKLEYPDKDTDYEATITEAIILLGFLGRRIRRAKTHNLEMNKLAQKLQSS